MTDDADRPAPMTPPECDLRDFQFMPLDIVRLFGSRFHAVANDAEWRAGVTLWAKSFHQVPAGSVPDDDIELCRLAELGRDMKAWKKVRENAMHGWVLCSDRRWYHPVVAEKANEAWTRKQSQRARSAKGNAARWGLRDRDADELGVGKGSRGESQSDPSDVRKGSQEDSFKESLKDPKGQGQGQGLVNTSEASPLHPTAAAPPAGLPNGKLNGHGSELPGIPPAVQPEPGPPPCPHQQLIALYAKHLGHLRQPARWDGARAEAMRTRWRECAEPSQFSRGYDSIDGGIAFWDRFFGYVAGSDLANGFPRENGKRWMPDLPWLVTKENFLKVIEGNYAE